MKSLLIVTGPQGSGNHLFSKIFSNHKDVFGWKNLTNTYWIPHEDEPFAEAWQDISKLRHIEFDKFAVTGISCPFVYHNSTYEPQYTNFINEAVNLGYNVQVAIIGRDQNILKFQQERVRLTYSFPAFEKHIPALKRYNPIFLSTELLYQYKSAYIDSLNNQLCIPCGVEESHLENILKQDPNQKYIHQPDEQPLDLHVRKINNIR